MIGSHLQRATGIARPILAALVILLLATGQPASGATVGRYWEFTPYKVRIVLASSTTPAVQQLIESQLAKSLQLHCKRVYGPLWKLDLQVATPSQQWRLQKDLSNFADDELEALRVDFDKLIVVGIREEVIGYTVSASEYDCLLESWGVPVSETTSGLASVEGIVFSAVEQVFSPVAQFRVIRETPDKAELSFKGEQLPRTSSAPVPKKGDVLRPVLRRVDRDGLPVEDGIDVATWTVLNIESTDTETPIASIESHTRMPFGTRQRGRVEQLAIGVADRGVQTKLRLHAKDSPDVALAGFEVFQQNLGEKTPRSIGKTNRDGTIDIVPGKTGVQTVLVRSSGQWIAKLPLVPGVDGLVEAPLVDDRKRLEAALRLTAIQEDIIDVVARRKIIEARVERYIKLKELDKAQELVNELNGLPNSTYFEQQRLNKEARLVESSDPRVNQTIDKMFGAVRGVLGEFLAPGLAQDLQTKINKAKEKSGN